jgi:hypothetical protein
MHDSASRVKPGYTLVSVDPIDSVIYIRSEKCSGRAAENLPSLCLSCQSIGPLADAIKQHASEAPDHLVFVSLSHAQAQKRLDATERLVKKQRFDVWILPFTRTVMLISAMTAFESEEDPFATSSASGDMEGYP